MEEVDKRLEVLGEQKTIFGKSIPITQFKNLEAKRKIKEEVKKMFNNQMIRSIITPRELDGNKRLDKLDRQKQTGDRDSNQNTMDRADSFGKKTMETISTFPEMLTNVYTALLSKEGDKVYDAFMGHNSRATGVLNCKRKYYAYDVHKFPVAFTKEACSIFNPNDYELNLGSSEKCKYPDETFDFSITCPPYFDVEKYSKLYEEEKEEDLSGKNYEDFLFTYYKCISETFRVLKYGSFFVIVVGDVHRAGKYTSLMLDTIKIGKMAGFTLHDINIYNRRSNIGGDLNYKTFILTCKRFPTIHEFILVFRKPCKCINCKVTTEDRLEFDGKNYCKTCYNKAVKNGEITEITSG